MLIILLIFGHVIWSFEYKCGPTYDVYSPLEILA